MHIRLFAIDMQVCIFLFTICKYIYTINITPHGPDDGSAEPKRYSVDPLINHSFHLDRCYQFFYIYICVCVCVCVCVRAHAHKDIHLHKYVERF